VISASKVFLKNRDYVISASKVFLKNRDYVISASRVVLKTGITFSASPGSS
jgi:hypothetical protein